MRVGGADQTLQAREVGEIQPPVPPSSFSAHAVGRPTFLVMMNEVPIAIDDETASARPMYLSFGSNVLATCCAASCAALIASMATCVESH